MYEPNRTERMIGEIVGLRLIVETLLQKNGGADAIREDLLRAVEEFEPRSDTADGAERIKACAENMLRNFPNPMNEKIT